MSQSIALSSGVHLPESAWLAARAAKARRAVAPSGPATMGGHWTKAGLAMSGGAYSARTERLRDYESYLNTAVNIPWVYQAGSTVSWSYAAAEANITIGQDLGAPSVDDGDPDLARLKNLLRQPNMAMGGHQLRERLAWHLQLTGNAFLVLDNLDGAGRPTELYLLRPSKVRIKPDPKDYISLYAYEVGGTLIPYDPANVIWFKRTNPRDEYWGLGVIEAGEPTFNKQRAIARTELAFFDSGARLKGVLTYDGILSDEQAEELKESWRAMDEGASGMYRTAVLQAGMEYKVIGSDLLSNGAGMETLAKMSRDEILTLFGVPKQKIGIFEDANYRSIEADSFFQAETMTPMLRDTNDGWTRLCQRFNKTWAYRHVEKVVTDYYDKAITSHYMAQAGVYKRNEIRIVGGQQPLDLEDARGEEIMGPTSMTVFEVGGPVQEAVQAQPGTGADQAPAHVAGTGRGQGLDDASDDDDDTSASGGSGSSRGATPPIKLDLPNLGGKATHPRQQRQMPCACPAAITLSRKGMSAVELGICPAHQNAVQHELDRGYKRQYSLQQLMAGYPRERYDGILAIIGRSSP